MRIALLIVLTMTFSSANADEQSWQKRRAEGWAWYHNFEKNKQREQVKEESKDPIIILGIAKEKLERALAIAMLNPSDENVFAYMVMHKQWTDQSRRFSRSWQHNLLEHPEVASMMPTTQYGVQIKKIVEAKSQQELLTNLSKRTTLLFFYEGNNPFSQAFGLAVQVFSEQFNWSVKPISVDGSFIKYFPNSIKDSTISKEMNVTIFPALFVVDNKTLKATPAAFGMMTVSQLEENIAMQFGEEKI